MSESIIFNKLIEEINSIPEIMPHKDHYEQSPESGFYFRKNDPEHLYETIR